MEASFRNTFPVDTIENHLKQALITFSLSCCLLEQHGRLLRSRCLEFDNNHGENPKEPIETRSETKRDKHGDCRELVNSQRGGRHTQIFLERSSPSKCKVISRIAPYKTLTPPASRLAERLLGQSGAARNPRWNFQRLFSSLHCCRVQPSCCCTRRCSLPRRNTLQHM